MKIEKRIEKRCAPCNTYERNGVLDSDYKPSGVYSTTDVFCPKCANAFLTQIDNLPTTR